MLSRDKENFGKRLRREQRGKEKTFCMTRHTNAMKIK